MVKKKQIICNEYKHLKIYQKTYPFCELNKRHVPWKVIKNKWVSDYCPLIHDQYRMFPLEGI